MWKGNVGCYIVILGVRGHTFLVLIIISLLAFRFDYCNISSKDCPGEDKAEEDFSSSGYKMKSDSLSFLMNPESKIQELW